MQKEAECGQSHAVYGTHYHGHSARCQHLFQKIRPKSDIMDYNQARKNITAAVSCCHISHPREGGGASSSISRGDMLTIPTAPSAGKRTANGMIAICGHRQYPQMQCVRCKQKKYISRVRDHSLRSMPRCSGTVRCGRSASPKARGVADGADLLGESGVLGLPHLTESLALGGGARRLAKKSDWGNMMDLLICSVF